MTTECEKLFSRELIRKTVGDLSVWCFEDSLLAERMYNFHMTEKDIFDHLVQIAPQSKDTDGVVTCCLVRDGALVLDAVSAGIEHAEYELIKKAKEVNITFSDSDTLYVTLQPCDRRTPGGGGEALGDCTTNTINAGIKNIVYGATYPKSINSLHRFAEAGVSIRQVSDRAIIKQCAELFNSTNDDVTKHIPIEDE